MSCYKKRCKELGHTLKTYVSLETRLLIMAHVPALLDLSFKTCVQNKLPYYNYMQPGAVQSSFANFLRCDETFDDGEIKKKRPAALHRTTPYGNRKR